MAYDNTSFLTLADVDNDGDLDVVEANEGYVNKVYKNAYYDSSAAATVSITVNPVNDNPTVQATISNVVVNEDAADTVFNLYPYFQDIENTDAQLTYTVSGDTNPSLFTAVTITDPTNFRLDYAPNANGIADIAIRATDSGGLWVEDAFRVTVNAVNDAPVLNNTGAPYLTVINEDETGNAGTLISQIIARGFGGDPISDVDSGALEGIAVTAAVTTHGSWRCTTDGSTWNALGAVADASARVLFADANTKLRFVPNADWNGTEDPRDHLAGLGWSRRLHEWGSRRECLGNRRYQPIQHSLRNCLHRGNCGERCSGLEQQRLSISDHVQ